MNGLLPFPANPTKKPKDIHKSPIPCNVPKKRGRKKLPCRLYHSASLLHLQTNKLLFDVLGSIQTKLRPCRGKNGNIYNPSKSAEKEFKECVSEILCGNNLPIFDHTLLLNVTIKFHFNVSSSKKLPDVDNCIKFVLDALKGVAYVDNRQINSVVGCCCSNSGIVDTTSVCVKLSKK